MVGAAHPAASIDARIPPVDWLFGQVVDALDALPLANRTGVFFSSDHGDFQGNYHLVSRARSVAAGARIFLFFVVCPFHAAS